MMLRNIHFPFLQFVWSNTRFRCYYYLIIFNVVSLVLYLAFYFPPTFAEKYENRRTKMEAIRMFDYVGTFLFIAGLVLFELGLLWGGQVCEVLYLFC